MNHIARTFMVVLTALGFTGCIPGRAQAPDCIRQRASKAEAEQETFVAALVAKVKEHPEQPLPAWAPGIIESHLDRQSELLIGIREWVAIQRKDFGAPKTPVEVDTFAETVARQGYSTQVDLKNMLVDVGRKKLGMPPIERDAPASGAGSGSLLSIFMGALGLGVVASVAAYGVKKSKQAKSSRARFDELSGAIANAASSHEEEKGKVEGAQT